MEDLANFARLVEAIRPWLTHVVIVGGWAHRLYRFHPLARLPLSFSRRTRLIGLESISSLSKAIERIFERQARSRLTLAGVRGFGLSGVSCLVGVASLSRLNLSSSLA